MSKTAAKAVIWAYVCAVGAYVVYSWITYSGTYRWFAEWQMEQFGSYTEKITLMVPLFVLLIPGLVLAKALGVGDQLRSSPKISGAASAGGVRMTALLGLALLVVAAASGWLGYRKATEPVVTEEVSLVAHQTAKSTHVRLTGIARPGLMTRLETKSAGSTRTDTYVPLTPADWKPGDPLVYFLKTNIDAYMPPNGGGTIMLQRQTPPFEMTDEGALVSDGLPGPIAEIYRKESIPLGSPPLVLDAINRSADLDIYWMVAFGGGLVGLILLVTAGALGMRRRRLSQA